MVESMVSEFAIMEIQEDPMQDPGHHLQVLLLLQMD
jgi:hypothetical protein